MELVYTVVILLLAIVPHEYAHAWMADKLGDSTAKDAGRLTLNPIKHIDPFGTIILPALFLLSGLKPFGWAKPVPVNFMRLRKPKRDMMWVGLAGPAVNVVIALVCSFLLKLTFPLEFEIFLLNALFINLLFAIFNMIPVPPLDGSRLVMGLLPRPLAYSYSRLEPYGILIVIALLYLGIFEQVIIPAVILAARLLGVQVV